MVVPPPGCRKGILPSASQGALEVYGFGGGGPTFPGLRNGSRKKIYLDSSSPTLTPAAPLRSIFSICNLSFSISTSGFHCVPLSLSLFLYLEVFSNKDITQTGSALLGQKHPFNPFFARPLLHLFHLTREGASSTPR